LKISDSQLSLLQKKYSFKFFIVIGLISACGVRRAACGVGLRLPRGVGGVRVRHEERRVVCGVWSEVEERGEIDWIYHESVADAGFRMPDADRRIPNDGRRLPVAARR
jgi:hypothetical protein